MTLPPIVKTITVPCKPERAFRYFTEDFGKWWPAASHSVVAFSSEFKDVPALCKLESGVNGRIYEKAADGTEHLWGSIFLWEPPTRLAFSWHPGRQEDTAQVVEVAFSEAAEGTRVVLTHTGWEKMAEEAEESWKSYNNGWATVFTSYSNYANSGRES